MSVLSAEIKRSTLWQRITTRLAGLKVRVLRNPNKERNSRSPSLRSALSIEPLKESVSDNKFSNSKGFREILNDQSRKLLKNISDFEKDKPIVIRNSDGTMVESANHNSQYIPF
ncbi:hypothetical protein KIN20_022334 [Parelaphostrongylus tenuis]|uniref:Uncharacterized protein n=1 Tax=Parelaphostrongylus tenuis TaxID=148309 RepID=A0AAD5NBJ1_PARTN|nr:hypothetical protein KIN20_022334 [Parelaphostrongylus tenuis]